MKSLPKVSICIISYNQETFISDAIESAIDQEYENLEIVVADDASQDSTASIITEIASRFPRRVIPVLGRTNLGVTGNSNRALEACSGEFIVVMGGDDILLPGKISKQVEWFRQDRKRALCGHRVQVFYADGDRASHLGRPAMKSATVERLLLKGVPAAACSIMMRAEALPTHGFEASLKVMSDLMLWIEVLALGGEYGSIEGVYAKQRRHAYNVSNDPLKYMDDYLNTYKTVAGRYPQYEKTCAVGVNRNFKYFKGVLLLQAGQKEGARKLFLETIRVDPLYDKSWIRLLQTFV
jgi:glycosyltransferase involved in cell wall biosynthesis